MNASEITATSIDIIYILGSVFGFGMMWLIRITFSRINEKHKLSEDGDARQEAKRKEDRKEFEAKLEKLEGKIDKHEDIRRLNDTKLYDRVTIVENRTTRIEGEDEGYQRGLAEGRRK